jgi:hypothetical protein
VPTTGNGASAIERLVTTGTGTGQGDLVGTVNAKVLGLAGGNQLISAVQTSRDLLADVNVTGSLEQSLRIGRTLSGTITLQQSGGLTKNIIINGENGSGAWPTNVGVVVGSSTILPDALGEYNEPSSAYGGAAVGLVPFRLYLADCNRQPDELNPGNVLPQPLLASTGEGLLLRFYGPLQDAGTAAPLVKIERDFVDVTSQFATEILGAAPSRTLRIRALSGDAALGGYVVSGLGTNGDLRCRNVAGSPPVDSFVYEFILAEDCNVNNVGDPLDLLDPILNCDGNAYVDSCEIAQNPSYDDYTPDFPGTPDGILDRCQLGGCAADFNGVNAITVQGNYDFLSDWNSQINNGPTIIGSADFNNSGTVTVQDIYDYLSAWAAGCA